MIHYTTFIIENLLVSFGKHFYFIKQLGFKYYLI